MTLLIAGLLSWSFFHLFKSIMPKTRAALETKTGTAPVKASMALIYVGSIILMIFGYIQYGSSPLYEPPSWGVHLNNLLMLIAVFLMGAGSGKGHAPTLLRHPMLAGVVVWSVAHLLANGDLRSTVLFGGLGIWAVLNMLTINKRDGAWDRPVAGPWKADIKTAVISLVVFGVIAAIHYFIGPSPFGG